MTRTFAVFVHSLTFAICCSLFDKSAMTADIDLSPPDAVANPQSGLMLDLHESGTDPGAINYAGLLHLPAQPAVVSDVRPAGGKSCPPARLFGLFSPGASGRCGAMALGLAKVPPRKALECRSRS